MGKGVDIAVRLRREADKRQRCGDYDAADTLIRAADIVDAAVDVVDAANCGLGVVLPDRFVGLLNDLEACIDRE